MITYIRFYPSDWLAGTRGMTAAETGIYITLIAMMYERAGPLVEDHARLARLCGASNSSFSNTLEMLIKDGKITRNEIGLSNERVEKEISYVREKSEVAREKIKSRWAKNPIKSKDDLYCGNTGEILTINHKPITNNIPPIIPQAEKPDKELQQAVEAYNRLADEIGLAKVQNFSETRKRSLRKRLAECGGPEGWQTALDKIRASPFLRGENNRGWKADFDFLMQAKSFTKLMEGAYDRSERKSAGEVAFANIDRRIAEIGRATEHDRSNNEPDGPGLFGEMPGDHSGY